MKKVLLFASLLLLTSTAYSVSVETSYCGQLQAVTASPWQVKVSERTLYLPRSTSQQEAARLQELRGESLCFEVEERDGKTWVLRVLRSSQ